MTAGVSVDGVVPVSDVMFGVDNTFLSRVVDESVFEAYTASGLDAIPESLRDLVPNGEAMAAFRHPNAYRPS